jgi:hypothetical protein
VATEEHKRHKKASWDDPVNSLENTDRRHSQRDSRGPAIRDSG